jgi:uncharacterized glyoxalase superfamily protein PhnB
MSPTSKIPEGYRTLTPSLTVSNAAEAIELYKKAFGAIEEEKMACGNTGKIMHASLKIGSSRIFLSDAMPAKAGKEGCQASMSSFYVYIEDVDFGMGKAKSAGMKETHAVEDMFWGDRTGCVKDKFGNTWTLATHVRDVSEAEMKEGGKKFAMKCAA